MAWLMTIWKKTKGKAQTLRVFAPNSPALCSCQKLLLLIYFNATGTLLKWQEVKPTCSVWQSVVFIFKPIQAGPPPFGLTVIGLPPIGVNEKSWLKRLCYQSLLVAWSEYERNISKCSFILWICTSKWTVLTLMWGSTWKIREPCNCGNWQGADTGGNLSLRATKTVCPHLDYPHLVQFGG